MRYQVDVKFGVIHALRLLDEGIVQDGVYSNNEIVKLKKCNFENVMYELTDGEFDIFLFNLT